MYGLSVLLKNPDWDQGEKSYLVHHLPWLIGSLGTLLLDLIVSFYKMSKKKKKEKHSCCDGASGLPAVPHTCHILGRAALAHEVVP